MTAQAGRLVLLPTAVDGALFGFPMFDVHDVASPPPLVGRLAPGAPRGYVGVAGDGSLATVIDLRAAFGRAPTDAAPGRRIVYAAYADGLYGFIVDAVAACASSSGAVARTAAPLWARPYLAAVYDSPLGVIAVIDIRRLLAPGVGGVGLRLRCAGAVEPVRIGL